MSKFFRNESPYSFWQAVCLLHKEWGDSTRRIITTYNEEQYITIEHYRGPYDSLSSNDNFRITPEAVQQLKNERLIIGEPYWGGRSTFKFLVRDTLDEYYYNTIGPRFRWNR